MKRIAALKEKWNDYVLEHPVLKFLTSNGFILIGTIIAAFALAYSYRALVSPSADITEPIIENGVLVDFNINHYNLIGGGVTGFGQVIILILDKLGIDYIISHATMQSIIYFAVNIPLFILAFFCIGKKFAIFSVINVLLTSVFISRRDMIDNQ